MNLAVNARDAMPNGGKLTIRTENVELDAVYSDLHLAVKPGKYIVLVVSDTGIGMDADTRKRIFEPFFTTKEVGKGTGLGLSTIYGIVKQSGGNIWVYSELGSGTTFKIYLPLALADDKEPMIQEVTADDTVRAITETILLVEDEEMVRKLTREILEEKGYRVLEAKNGEEAVAIANGNANSIQLLLTDVVMTRMNGKKAADTMGPLHPSMKILYMSGYTDDAIVHHGVLDAGTNFIEKPFTAERLSSKVREVLDDLQCSGSPYPVNVESLTIAP
jgi:CheY-like chemotaxis protein